MDNSNLDVESDDYDWNTDDELEIDNFMPTSTLTLTGGIATVGSGEASSSTDSKLFDHFVGMGFPAKLVTKAIQENGEESADLILETLLTYSALESPGRPHEVGVSPGKRPERCSDNSSSGYEEFLVDDSDFDISSENEEVETTESAFERKLASLVKMGYEAEVVSAALKRCGLNSPVSDLVDFITAAEMAKEADAFLVEEKPQPLCNKRRFYECEVLGKKKHRMLEKKFQAEDDDALHLPNPMIGFGVPNEPYSITQRSLPEQAMGPPFFYFENVALAPRGVWKTISRFLYDVEPEFVDSKYFCAAARKRGYVHNLPIQDRFHLVPLPPMTVLDALPLTRKWWPSWDHRRKLNCLQTCVGSAKLTERIRKAVEDHDGVPPLHIQKYVLDECRKWNLVWVGRNKVAPLEPDEVETLLGFPKNHTRGGGISRTDRYKSLGNSFQVDTVAYHLSVLKKQYPNGLNLLSLFSGIGGAEVALHRLGIRLNTVVSVEKSEVNRNIVRSWWEQTNQKGNLIDLDDVQKLTTEKIKETINAFGGFDLVVGGSPCNNLTGSNRHTRDGLEGKESALFYDFFRILNDVKLLQADMV